MLETGRVSSSKLPIAMAAGAVAAAVGNVVVFFVFNRLLNVPFSMPSSLSSPELVQLTITEVLWASVLPAVAGGIFLGALDKLTENPFKGFFAVAVGFLIFSLTFPVSLPDTVVFGTKIGLELMHIVAGVTITWALLTMSRE